MASDGMMADARKALWHFRQGGFSQVREWQRRNGVPKAAKGLAHERLVQGRFQVSFNEAPMPDREPTFASFKVATILDAFSSLAWSYEFTTFPVKPNDWREVFAREQIDLLFVESAWHGNDDAWQFQLTGSKAPSEELRALVAYCQECGIPTVLWNKEDPPHFEDFLPTARIFDHVFTTDVTLIEAYKRELGHERVGLLPFAASSAIHNPVRPQNGFHDRDVAFGGMYFAHKFPERREQMDIILGGALEASEKMERGLEIFSRFLGDDERYQFPGELGERVVGSLSYPQMLTAYKAYRVFLNVNSVVTSESMCARRIFEITASGTSVISTPSPAISTFFPPSEVPVVSSREEARDTVRAFVRSPELADRTVHAAQRRIWRHHTYTDRARRVARQVGLELSSAVVGADGSLPSVSAVTCTNRPHQMEHVLQQAARQRRVDLQLVLVTHGFSPDELHLRARAKELGIRELVLSPAAAELSLGEVFNQGVSVADGQIVTKFDDDDLYGPHYLEDLLHAKAFSRADVVGKDAHYMYVASRDATLLRFAHREHRFGHRVMGPTITAARELFTEVPFEARQRGEDSRFLEQVMEAGGTVYGADRFNFVQIRGASGHTWSLGDMEALASGDVAWFGVNEGHIFF